MKARNLEPGGAHTIGATAAAAGAARGARFVAARAFLAARLVCLCETGDWIYLRMHLMLCELEEKAVTIS